MASVAYKLVAGFGLDRLKLWLDSARLRIMAYHGVCEDRCMAEPWLPRHFVARSQFEQQLGYLKANARVLPLAEAVMRLQNGTLPSRTVCITFDDGYSNNLSLAYPLLERYGLPATIFLSTGFLEGASDFFPSDRWRLLREARDRSMPPGDLGGSLPDYKTTPIDVVLERVEQRWHQVQWRLSPELRETLRPLHADELKKFDPRLVDFGAHTHSHCILNNETPDRRRQEIVRSLECVSQWTGRPAQLFSYPNGQPGDFGELDKAVLRSQGVLAAVTTIPGANRRGCDSLELKRYPVGLGHDAHAFAAELTGWRTVLQTFR